MCLFYSLSVCLDLSPSVYLYLTLSVSVCLLHSISVFYEILLCYIKKLPKMILFLKSSNQPFPGIGNNLVNKSCQSEVSPIIPPLMTPPFISKQPDPSTSQPISMTDERRSSGRFSKTDFSRISSKRFRPKLRHTKSDLSLHSSSMSSSNKVRYLLYHETFYCKTVNQNDDFFTM